MSLTEPSLLSRGTRCDQGTRLTYINEASFRSLGLCFETALPLAELSQRSLQAIEFPDQSAICLIRTLQVTSARDVLQGNGCLKRASVGKVRNCSFQGVSSGGERIRILPLESPAQVRHEYRVFLEEGFHERGTEFGTSVGASEK